MLTHIPLRGQSMYHKCKKLIIQGYQVNYSQCSKNQTFYNVLQQAGELVGGVRKGKSVESGWPR